MAKLGVSGGVTRGKCPLGTVCCELSLHHAQLPSKIEPDASSLLDPATIAGNQLPSTISLQHQGPTQGWNPADNYQDLSARPKP